MPGTGDTDIGQGGRLCDGLRQLARLTTIVAGLGLLSLVAMAWASYLRGRSVDLLGVRLAGTPGAGPPIPEGAVIAFLGEDCPDPWQVYRPGAGRFVLGAGSALNRDANDTELPVFRAGDMGGQAGVTLQLPDLPPHTHRLGIGRLEAGRSLALPLPATKALPQFGVVAPFAHKSGLGRTNYDLLDAVESAGGFPTRLGGVAARRHDNIPPFVALTYCIYSREYELRAGTTK